MKQIAEINTPVSYTHLDSDSHFDFTNLRFIKLYDTPEKIIGYISKHNAVIGLLSLIHLSANKTLRLICFLSRFDIFF